MKIRQFALLILSFVVAGAAAVHGQNRFSLDYFQKKTSVRGVRFGAPAKAALAPAVNQVVQAGFAVDVDASGVSFVAGVEVDLSFQSNGWLAKYDQHQVLLSSVTFPQGAFYRIARDSFGKIYVVGRLDKEVETDVGTKSDSDILVCKYDSSLHLLKSNIIQGIDSGGYDDGANDLAFSPDGDLVVVGFIENALGHKIAWFGKFDNDLNVTAYTYDPPEVLSSQGSSLTFDSQGNIYIAAEVILHPVNFESTYYSTNILKYDAGFHFLGSVKVIEKPGINYEPNRIITDTNGDFVLFGEKWDLGNRQDFSDDHVSMWIGRVSPDSSKIQTVDIDPSSLDEAPRDMELDEEGNIYLAAMINIGEDGGSDKSLGWVARYSPALVQQSSFTISGNDPQGTNGAFGLKVVDTSLYVTGAISNLAGTMPFLRKISSAENLDLPDPSSDNMSEVRGYPSVFQPSKGHTGITFDQMTANSTIKIYSTTGGLVKEIHAPTGVYLWNVKNDGGEDIASGVYLVRVSGSGGDKTFKIVVQR
jgi:hypothetical protein